MLHQQIATPHRHKAVDWHSPLQTQHDKPRHAELLSGQGPRGQRRVSVLGDYAASLPKADPKSTAATTFLYNEDGQIDGDTSGVFALVNVA